MLESRSLRAAFFVPAFVRGAPVAISLGKSLEN